MLNYLKVANLAVIESAELEFGEGFTCLTGETGAGKSLIVDALGILAGRRVSPDSIRTGQQKAVIEATFLLPDHFERSGFDLIEEKELILRREIFSEGRSRAFVNGVMVPNNLLQEYAAQVFEIHGQHGQQALLKEGSHCALFDRHADISHKVVSLEKKIHEFFVQWKDYWASVKNEQENRKELDFLYHQIAEIDKAQLTDEDDEIDTKLKIAENAEWIFNTRQEIAQGLDRNLVPGAKKLLHQLEKLSSFDPALSAYCEQLTGLQVTLGELNHEIQARLYDEVDEHELEVLRLRQTLLNQLFLKYGQNRHEVLQEGLRLEARRDELEAATGDLKGWWNKLETEYQVLCNLKSHLDKDRMEKTPEFESELVKVLQQLSFPHAVFQNAWDWSSWPAKLEEKPDLKFPRSSLVFKFSPNPGEHPRSLHKVASGGELSRVMLALIVSLTRERGKTLVFDEVDAGLGGETAELVGRKLASLGESNQVFCVTHLAQVAQFASRHWNVLKKVVNERTQTEFVNLTGGKRVEELARLMGGNSKADGLLQHAREMMLVSGNAPEN